MTYYALSEPLWQLSENVDRRFKRALAFFFVPLVILGVIIPFLTLEGLQRGGGTLEGDRYAELLKQAPPAPLAEKAEEPKKAEEEKPKEKPVEPKPAPEKQQPAPEVTHEQQVQQARQVASRTGVMALADQLADLRDEKLHSVDQSQALTSVVTARTGTGDTTGTTASPSSIAQAMQATSGGISGTGTGEERRAQGGTGIGTRRTTTVTSPVGFGEDKTRPGQGGDKLLAGRTLEEIQLTFDRNKGAFYAIFNRAMRDNPNLAAGKIVVSITIAPDGSVTACTMVSSTFNDPELERKVIQRVQLLNFGAKAVPPFTYPNYPINFLPS